MKIENTLINTIKNSIPISLRRNNVPLVKKLLNDKAKKEGFVNWKYLCDENRKELSKIYELNDSNKGLQSILENSASNTILIENNPQLNNEILRQKIKNKETIIILADLKNSELNHLLDILKIKNNHYQFNVISDNNLNQNIEKRAINKKAINNTFLTKYIDVQNIRDFILDMMDMSSVWSNKPMLLFASYWTAMSYKMEKMEYEDFQELKDMIQFNQYFSLYEELKGNQNCPKHIWIAMENFLKNLPQINLNSKEQTQVVYEQYGFIQMQIMRLINNLLAFENNTSKKQLTGILNSKKITILNIYSEELNKKEFNLRLYLYLIHTIYKNKHEEVIKKNRKITIDLINVLNEKAIDKLFYLNNNAISIIACITNNEIHNLLKDNFQTIIKDEAASS